MTTEAGRQAVEMRGLFGGETKERASEWVRRIEAEARESPREPGLDVAARAFAEHVSAIACDHTGTGAGTHTGCPERLALDAALASEDRP